MHTTIDNTTDDQSKYGAVVELPFPDVVPKDGSCAVLDLMRVVEVCEGPRENTARLLRRTCGTRVLARWVGRLLGRDSCRGRLGHCVRP
jgi:hypothetical protein